MHCVQISFQELPRGIYVTFMQQNRALGRPLRFADEQTFQEMLHRAGSSLEDRNIAEHALRVRRAGWLELRLDDEQFARLKAKLQR